MEPTISNLQSQIKNFPQEPGVYQFHNKNAEVIYVGKAKNLKNRVGQYFSGHDTRPQLPYLLEEATDVTYTVVTNELESLFLESTLIKKYLPRYNIMLRDDKNYAFIKIDYSTEIPQIGYARKIEEKFKTNLSRSRAKGSLGYTSASISRSASDEKSVNLRRIDPSTPRLHSSVGMEHAGTEIQGIKRLNSEPKYFGPYSAAWKIRNTLNLVRRIFPYCSAEKVGSRPCFYYYLHRCPGVCIGKISLQEYGLQLEKICWFLSGHTGKAVQEIKSEMKLAAAAKQFEKAARLRDQLQALELLQEKQNAIMAKPVSWDIVSLAEDSGYACVNLFKIREGKMLDKEDFVFEVGGVGADLIRPIQDGKIRSSPTGNPDVLQSFLEQYYLETSDVPKVIYTQVAAEDSELIQHIVRSRFDRKVEISNPKKAKPLELVKIGTANAQEYLKNWLSSQAGHLDKINTALEELKNHLHLEKIPERIECYDISNIQGTNPVGSMVVFKNGLPAKSEYRKFKIQSKKTPDDFAMMREMLTRRFSRSVGADLLVRRSLGEVGIRPNQDGKIRSSPTGWPLPDLIVIDGGKGQLAVAVAVLSTFNLQLPTIGLAKRIEEIFFPGNPEPLILSHDNPGLQLLQRLRDEAHRFGITFHRQLRSKQAVKSALDEIPGIGPKTKKLLKQKFGTVAEIRKTSFKELEAVVGKIIAQNITNNL